MDKGLDCEWHDSVTSPNGRGSVTIVTMKILSLARTIYNHDEDSVPCSDNISLEAVDFLSSEHGSVR